MECSSSLPSDASARTGIIAPVHSPPAVGTTVTATVCNGGSCSNTDPDAGSTSGNSAAIQSSLRQLNRNSYKISRHGGDHGHNRPRPPPPPSSEASPAMPPPRPPPPNQQPPPQPPVYNIHKNDFRDVVQKLTGSPAHHPRAPTPPAASATAAPKHAQPSPPAGGSTTGATSSRLQKIRPPPLAQLTPRSPSSLGPTSNGNPFAQTGGDTGLSTAWTRSSPLSPLPPLPMVSAAAESPITAYMRCLRSGVVPHQQGLNPSPRSALSGGSLLPLAPSSPLGFGCLPSPRSACQGVLPSALPLPPSPTPSPRWGNQ